MRIGVSEDSSIVYSAPQIVVCCAVFISKDFRETKINTTMKMNRKTQDLKHRKPSNHQISRHMHTFNGNRQEIDVLQNDDEMVRSSVESVNGLQMDSY